MRERERERKSERRRRKKGDFGAWERACGGCRRGGVLKVLASFKNHDEACNMLCGKGRVRTKTSGTKAERNDYCATRQVWRRIILGRHLALLKLNRGRHSASRKWRPPLHAGSTHARLHVVSPGVNIFCLLLSIASRFLPYSSTLSSTLTLNCPTLGAPTLQRFVWQLG